MVTQNRSVGVELSPEALTEITRLYESGRYVQACQRADAAGPVAEWTTTAARLIGGRLANNVHAPRLARWLHGQAWRRDRASVEAAYYFASKLRNWRGPLAAWKFLRRLPDFPDASPERRADLLTLRASVLSSFRDFDSATRLLEEARQLDPHRPWFWVEQGSLYEQQDAYEEALAASRHALELQPWFRPGVQAVAHHLQLLGRDDEALDLLERALEHLQSAGVAGQLAVLQTELGQHSAALASWEKVRALSPWMEPRIADWWETRISDARYFIGDLAGAADAAERSRNPFHEKLVERLRTPAADAKRVLLPVGFVRQHHFTCAPATLSALSRYWKMPVDHVALAAAICYDGTPDHIERHWALENGWYAREFRVTWEILVALLDRGVPFTLTTVETQSAHLQAVIGYDSIRGTILIRDPYERVHGEWLAAEFLERYAASGPRGMLLLPPAEMARIEGLELPEAGLYDDYYALRRALHLYDREAAQQHCESLESAAPAHRLTLDARRQLASYDGSLPRQLAAVDELLALHPRHGNYLWARLALLRDLARRAEYQEFLRELCADAECDPIFWREWAAELSADARRQGDAERLLNRALHRRPLDPDNLNARANLHWERREFAEATELHRLAANLRDKVDFYSRSYFLAARHLRQTEAALELLTQRYEKFRGQSAQPTRLLFWALNVLDRQPEAFEKVEAGLALRPEDGELLLFAADAFARHGQAERAETLLGAAEKRASRSAWLRTAACLADYRCDLSTALAQWREVLTEEPLAMDAQRAVTRLLADTQGRATALAHLAETCARFDHHVGLHELWVEWARGDGPDALEPVLHQLLTLHPEHAWAYRELALLYSGQHRPEEAANALDYAAQLEPHSPSNAGVRAQIALQTGHLVEAREQARAALQLSVDYEAAIRTLFNASPGFEDKRAAVAFLRDELSRQVVFGDGLLAYRGLAFEVIEPPELLASLRVALHARPDLWHAWSAVVLQLVDMQQLEEALALARQATERFPLLPRLWLDLALVHRTRGEREPEIAPLQRALQLSPGWGQASRQLADTHQRMGQYEEAAEVLERAIAASPLDPYNHGCLADVLQHLQRPGEAAAKLEHALKLEPGYTWAWEALRTWSPEQGEKSSAVRLARELTELRAGEARSWLILAESLGASALEPRLAALDHATTLDPRSLEAHDLRAQLFAEAGRWEEATAACTPAAFGDQPPTLLRGRAAWLEERQGRTRAAIARMREVVEQAPDYYWGWNMLAEWLTADHDFPAAEEAARKMARLSPRNAIPLGYLADIQLQSGQEDTAYETFERAYAIDPTYAYAGFALFNRHLAQDRLADAGRLIGLLTTHLPGPRAVAAQARLHARLGRKDAALATLRQLLTVDISQSPALHTTMKALVDAGWGSEAETVLANALGQLGVNPEVGPIWVRHFASRGAWKSRKRLYRLSPHSEIGRRARIAYIEELAHHGQLWNLNRLLRRERAIVRESATLWGTVGYAYVHLRRWSDAVRWMEDWKRRKGVEPWMLLNLATALREQRSDDKALAINRHALTLGSDHTSPQHQLWIAFDAGLRGQLPVLEAGLAELREHDLGDYEKALLTLVKPLRTLQSAAPEERPALLRELRKEIAQHQQQGIYRDAVLQRARRRCLTALSRASNDRWAWLRSWLPEPGGVGIPGQRSLIPAIIIALAILGATAMHTYRPSKTPALSSVPSPTHTSTSTAPTPAPVLPRTHFRAVDPTFTLDPNATAAPSALLPAPGQPRPILFNPEAQTPLPPFLPEPDSIRETLRIPAKPGGDAIRME